MSSITGVYRPRRPEKTALYTIVQENLETFLELYDQRFLETWGELPGRAVRTLRAFLTCGILWHGLARLKCEDCGQERVLAFSCQLRGVCPSCAGKRVELFTRFVLDEIVDPVPHRQLVFVLPKLLRRFIHHDAAMLSLLCRTMNATLTEFYRVGLARPDVRLGAICHIQLFGDQVNPHVHLHVVTTDGAQDHEGFHHLPLGPEDLDALAALFARRLLDALVHHGRISRLLAEKILSWHHTGFSVDGSVRVATHDREGLARLLRYVSRPPVANDRVSYDASTGVVTVSSAKQRGGIRPITARYDPLEFLALLVQQVPPTGCHVVRYYGLYSARTRADRDQKDDPTRTLPPSPTDGAPGARARRRRWAELIRLVFEVDPLLCTCGGTLKILAFITTAQPAVIASILESIGVEPVLPPARGPPRWLQAQRMARDTAQARRQDESTDWDVYQPAPPDEVYGIDVEYLD